MRIRYIWSGPSVCDECHKGSSNRDLYGFKDARVLKECRKERHRPRNTARIAVGQTVHDGDKRRHQTCAQSQGPCDVDEPPRQAANEAFRPD